MFKLSYILFSVCLGYFLFTSWSMYEIFYPKNCKGSVGCLQPAWNSDDLFKIHLDSVKDNHIENIVKTDVFQIGDGVVTKFNYTFSRSLGDKASSLVRVQFVTSDGVVVRSEKVNLVTYKEPTRTALNLLTNNGSHGNSSNDQNQLVPFWLSTLRVYILNSAVNFSRYNIPVEIARRIHLSSKGYLPVIYVNPNFQTSSDWIELKQSPENHQLEMVLSAEPTSFGSIRLRCMLENVADQLRSYGLNEKDINDVRGIFLDTNFYLLITTIFVSVFHLLFNFLAFKNDISFWRHADNTVGLSIRTVVWRFFSSLIIFLHLWEEKSSLLVSVPMGISTIIELWKLGRMTKLSISFRKGIQWGERSKAEKATDQLDAEFMRWLMYIMLPLCIGGSIYSLVYLPHRSWYSWCLETMVNGVYAFGLLLMTPQLFLNYRLKSVAHLPWKAMTYKAFNTFIDDFFAFIIVMPTSHRIACLRDDLIFLIYLYQRWLYPVDKSRVNEFGQAGDGDGPSTASSPVKAKKTQ
ncbi:unnamed protein product [Trichobilharzia szidati]|nr:unnamed protein product [Trichobilharzia szidati]